VEEPLVEAAVPARRVEKCQRIPTLVHAREWGLDGLQTLARLVHFDVCRERALGPSFLALADGLRARLGQGEHELGAPAPQPRLDGHAHRHSTL